MINSKFYVLLRSIHLYESMRDSIHKGRTGLLMVLPCSAWDPVAYSSRMTEQDPSKEKQGRPGVSEHLGDGKGQ